jgi:uncharacterized membrane protein
LSSAVIAGDRIDGWQAYADPQIAQVIPESIDASIMPVASIVFATFLMTLAQASMQFSP